MVSIRTLWVEADDVFGLFCLTGCLQTPSCIKSKQDFGGMLQSDEGATKTPPCKQAGYQGHLEVERNQITVNICSTPGLHVMP